MNRKKLSILLAGIVVLTVGLLLFMNRDSADGTPKGYVKKFYRTLLADDYEDYRALMKGEVQIDEQAFHDYSIELQREKFKKPTIERELTLGEDVLLLGDQDDWHHVFQKIDGEYVYLGIDQESFPVKFRFDFMKMNKEIEIGLPNPPAPTSEQRLSKDEAVELIANYQKDLTNEELGLKLVQGSVDSPGFDKAQLDSTIYSNLMKNSIRKNEYLKALYYGSQAYDGSDSGVMSQAHWAAYVYLRSGQTGKALALYQANASILPESSDSVLYQTIMYSDSYASAMRKVEQLNLYSLEMRDVSAFLEPSVSPIRGFEGSWSTPGSDELAFDLSFTDEDSGVITFVMEGEKSPNTIRYAYENETVNFNIEGGETLYTMKLESPSTMILKGTDGLQYTLRKIENGVPSEDSPLDDKDPSEPLTRDEEFSEEQYSYWKELISSFEGEWENPGELRFEIEYKGDLDQGTITYYSVENERLTYPFRYIELAANHIMLFLDDDSKSKVELILVDDRTLDYIISGFDGEELSGDWITLNKV